MLNQTVITGRLTRDIEMRYTKNDQTPVTSFSIAVKRDFIREGEPDTDFFEVVAWRSTAEFIGKYFTKGSLITVVGYLQNRQWKDKHDQNRVTTEIIATKAHFADSKSKGDINGNDETNDIEPFEPDIPANNGDPSENDGFQTPPPNFDPFS